MDELSAEKKIEQLNDRLDTVVNSFEKLQIQFQELITVIKGNADYGTKGYSSRMKDIEKEQKEAAIERLHTDRRIDKIYYRVLGICTGVSIATVIFAWLFTNVVVDDKREVNMPKINPELTLTPLIPEGAFAADTDIPIIPLKMSPKEAALDTFIEPKLNR